MKLDTEMGDAEWADTFVAEFCDTGEILSEPNKRAIREYLIRRLAQARAEARAGALDAVTTYVNRLRRTS